VLKLRIPAVKNSNDVFSRLDTVLPWVGPTSWW